MSSFQISYFILVSLIYSSVFVFYSHLRVSFPFERCAFVCHAERKKTVSGRLNRYLIEGNRRIEFLLFMLLYSCLIHSLLWKDMNLFFFFSIFVFLYSNLQQFPLGDAFLFVTWKGRKRYQRKAKLVTL